MESTSGVSWQSNTQKTDSYETQWDKELSGVSGSGSTQSGWRVEQTQATSETESQGTVTDENGQFKPEVQKTLEDFIGTMTIEMMKQNSPSKKISMDGDDE
jgi:hypothetical protein